MGIFKKLLKRLRPKDLIQDETDRVIIKPKMKRVVIVGDGACGKSCLIRRYVDDDFLPDQYTPTLFDVRSKQVDTDMEKVLLVLHDTAGQKELDALRPSLYYQSDVVVVCFSLDDPNSLVNIRDKWKDEISKYCSDLPVILVGTKSDLAENTTSLESTRKCETCRLVSKLGHTMATIIGAEKYMECSALQGKGVDDIFEEAVNLAQARDLRLRRRSSIFRRGSILLGLKVN